MIWSQGEGNTETLKENKGENTVKAYSVNHVTRSIILTRNFAKAASDPTTDQYRIFLQLRKDNPGYEIIQRTITKKEGKRKPPSYAQMIKSISCVENSDFYMARFEAMREEAASKNGSYTRVLKWFRQTFPNFYVMPEYNADNEIIVTPVSFPFEEDTHDTDAVA